MKKASKISLSRILSVTVMCFCLLFLTGANFVIYPPAHSFCSSASHRGDNGDEERPGPTEEKSSSKTNLSLQEEYIHELHSLHDLSVFVLISKHKIPAAEKLLVVHTELDAPPPKA